MTTVQILTCPSCAAPVTMPSATVVIHCPYCRSPLNIQVTDGQAILSVAHRVANAVQASVQKTSAAVETGTAITKAELRRVQLTQELTIARLRLDNTRSEMRTLHFQRSGLQSWLQMRELRRQEQEILAQIHAVNCELNPRSADLSPPPPQAVDTGDGPLWLFFSPLGRATRSDFWKGVIILFIAALTLSFLTNAGEGQLPVPALFAFLALAWSAYAVTVKRLHDLGKSAYWTFVIFVPIAGILLLLLAAGFLPSTDESTPYE